MDALRSPHERVERYSTWLAQYQLLLLPFSGAGDDAPGSRGGIEVGAVPPDLTVGRLVVGGTQTDQ